jgi:hypothetical protein
MKKEWGTSNIKSELYLLQFNIKNESMYTANLFYEQPSYYGEREKTV